jgi:hypothetical protein
MDGVSRHPYVITPYDFISLPYTAEMTGAGIAYACRSLIHTYDRMGGSDFERMRRIVGGKAVELAFLRRLQALDIPYDLRGATPFTDPDQYDIALRGRRCDVKSYVILHKDRIRKLRQNPELLLDAAALVPAGQLDSEMMGDHDYYVFAFIYALTASSQAEMQKALAANQPVFLIAPLGAPWSQTAHWQSLGKLTAKSGASSSLKLELGGQGMQREFVTETFDLAPQQRLTVESDFYTLSYLHADRMPDGPLGIYSPTRRDVCVIGPPEWGNIWVYGMEIILAGYMPCGEFRRRAKYLPAGKAVFQYPRTRTPNYYLPISELYSLPSLLKRVAGTDG